MTLSNLTSFTWAMAAINLSRGECHHHCNHHHKCKYDDNYNNYYTCQDHHVCHGQRVQCMIITGQSLPSHNHHHDHRYHCDLWYHHDHPSHQNERGANCGMPDTPGTKLDETVQFPAILCRRHHPSNIFIHIQYFDNILSLYIR